MALSCLQIVQTVARRIGINVPNAAYTSLDNQILQILSIVEEEGQSLADRYPWQALQKEATFTTVATQIQTAISTVTTGFNYIVNDTIWNRSLRRPVYGPRSQQQWQEAKAMQLNGPFNIFRIIASSINFYPTPAAGESCYFEYLTRNWISTSTSSTSSTWTNDADTPLLDDQLITLGAIWRWKQAKGLTYAEDFDKYERRVMDAMNRDAGKQTLSMQGGNRYEIQPVILVPTGSFGQ